MATTLGTRLAFGHCGGLHCAQHLRSKGPVICCAPFNGVLPATEDAARTVVKTVRAFLLLRTKKRLVKRRFR